MRECLLFLLLVAAYALGYVGLSGAYAVRDWLARPHNAIFVFRLAIVGIGAALLLGSSEADAVRLHADSFAAVQQFGHPEFVVSASNRS